MTGSDWTNWLLAGLASTVALSVIEAGSQELRLTRMSIPYLLGTMFTPHRAKAKVLGFFAHLVNGQLFGLVYVALFHRIGETGALWGLILGLAHAIIVLLLGVPLLAAVHPRIAREDAGPTGMRQLEPPGALALHYGTATPMWIVIGHAAYGVLFGILYHLPNR
jgi:uncharacterized membrane protein YagU involved in acid resistance